VVRERDAVKYGITRLVLECGQFIELTSDEYDAAKQAKVSLVTALGIEEKFNLVIENYAEFELELQARTTRYALFLDHDWSSSMDDLHTINRRLVNLLSAGRLYIDQVKHDVSELFGSDSEQLGELKKAFAKQYDAHLGYRVLEALRNHVQHRNLPVYHLGYSIVRDPHEQVTLAKYTCTPSMSVASIKEQGSFKAQVLQELRDGDDLVDLRPFVRQYVASIGQVHTDLRERMTKAVESWGAQMELIKEKFREMYGDQLAGLVVVTKDDQDVVVESSHVVKEVMTRRRALENKNRSVAHVATHYVSTEAFDGKLRSS